MSVQALSAVSTISPATVATAAPVAPYRRTTAPTAHHDIRAGSAVYGGLAAPQQRRLALLAALAIVRARPSNFVVDELQPLLARPLVARALGPARRISRAVRPASRPGQIVQRDR